LLDKIMMPVIYSAVYSEILLKVYYRFLLLCVKVRCLYSEGLF